MKAVCRRDLPYELQSYDQYSDLKNQAAQAARTALERLGDVADWQMKAAASAAIKPMVAEFEHRQRCAKLSSTLPSDLTSAEQQEARGLIQEALSQLPANTSPQKLEKVREEALAPFRPRLAQREHERRLQRVLYSISGSLPWNMYGSDRQEALAEIEAAVKKLPVGTSEQDMAGTRDRVLNRIKKEHETTKRLKALIERGLSEIAPYIRTLVQKGDLELELGETSYSVAEELKPAVREALEDELDGTETDEALNKLVHEIVDEEFDL